MFIIFLLLYLKKAKHFHNTQIKKTNILLKKLQYFRDNHRYVAFNRETICVFLKPIVTMYLEFYRQETKVFLSIIKNISEMSFRYVSRHCLRTIK